MLLRNPNYPEYYVKKDGNSISIFRDGSDVPLKSLSGYKKNAKYALYQNGRRKVVALFDFLKGALQK